MLGTLALSACGSSTPVPWSNYPHLWSKATPKPWLIIGCKVKGTADAPSDLLYQAERFLTVGGGGQGNIADYFSDVSYGRISLVGTSAIGWYTAPFTQQDIQTKYNGPQYRGTLTQLCANAVPEADADFSAYWGVIWLQNFDDGGGACDDGQHPMSIHGHTYNLACVVFNQNSLFTAFGAHEIGHGYGWVHSFDDTKCEYCDPFDIMSALCTYRFSGPNFPANGDDKYCMGSHDYDGPGVNVPNLLWQGWIPGNRIATYHIGTPKATFTLTALSHPTGTHPLTVEIVGSDPNDIYTVEYRQKDGWDTGLPDNTVLMHEYKQGQNPWSYLIRNTATYSGEWLAGTTWNDASPYTSTVSVTVSSIDPTTGTATVVIGPPKPFSGQPHINILAPNNGSFFAVGQQFQLSATATNSSGQPLPDADVTCKANSTPLGTGKFLTTALTTPGTYTITATANDNGDTASASVTVNVVQKPTPTPPAKPTVQILSPTPGQNFQFYGGSISITLASSASSGVVKYQWSDSLGMLSDTNANDTVTVTPTQQQAPCGTTTDTITLKVTDNHGQTASASVPITLQHVCLG
jgi:hypothetical protein